MKKTLSKIFLVLIATGLLAFAFYMLYIKPLLEIDGLDNWVDYAIAITTLTLVYVVIYFIIKCFFKLVETALNNL